MEAGKYAQWRCVFCRTETDRPINLGDSMQCRNCGHPTQPVEPVTVH